MSGGSGAPRRTLLRIVAGAAAAALASLPACAQDGPKDGVLPPFDVVVVASTATIPAPLTTPPGDAGAGAAVIADRHRGNCLSCHAISTLRGEEFHGDVGPALDGVADRWAAPVLRMIVVNAKMVFGPGTMMPAFYRVEGLDRVRPEFAGKPILTAREVEDVVAFLATLK